MSLSIGESLDDLPLAARLRARAALPGSELDGRVEDLRATEIRARAPHLSKACDSAGHNVIVFASFIAVADRAVAGIPARAGATREAVTA